MNIFIKRVLNKVLESERYNEVERIESDLNYKIMCFWYKVRDFFSPPLNMLKEANINPGYDVLDFGCGPGSYSIAAAKVVRETGRIYSLDINPLAVKKVERKAIKLGLSNIKTIQSDVKTGLPDGSMDVILLYDVYHDLYNKLQVLEELHRILRPEGILSFSDHHMEKEKILLDLTGGGLFRLKKEHKKTYSFAKI
jgi:ubiquinone/menaquinone biosynthesis C-methylase UbiE